MKIKKLLLTLIAVMTALVCSVASLTGCGADHVHSYDYTIITPATCVSEGLRHGVCRICNKEVDEVIPVTPDAHVYGEWDITQLPGEDTAGKAVKTCSKDGYILEVELPKLSAVASVDDTDKSGKYLETDIVTVEQASALHEGKCQYTYKHEAGDIVFEVVVPPRGVETVADAIDALTECHDKVRSGEGSYGYGRINMLGEDMEVATGTYYQSTKVSYEFGDNYTHSYETGNNTERWCSLDENGDLFAFVSINKGTVTKEINENYLQGPMIPVMGTDMNGYGAEGLLKSLYAIASTNNNRDYEESYSQKDGYFFKFGYISRNTLGMQTLAIVEVTFNLTEEYTLDNLKVFTNAYVNMKGESETDSSGKEIPIETWEMDEDGVGTLIVPEYTGYRYYVNIDVTQKTVTQAEKDGDAVPVNPYSKDEIMFSDFDLNYGGNEVKEDTPLQISADALISINVTNAVPSTVNYNFDTINVYLIKNGQETLLSAESMGTENIIGYFNAAAKTVILRSHLAGEVKLKIASAYVTKYVTLEVAEIAPSELRPSVYEYNDSSYIWKESTSDLPMQISTTARVGQPVWFAVEPNASEVTYAYKDWFVRLIQKQNSSGVFENTEAATVTEQTKIVGGKTVREFVATEAGTYRVQFRTMFNNGTAAVGGVVTIVVEDIPDMAAEIAGTYSASVIYPRRGKVTVEISISGNQGTATITDSENSREILSFTLTQTATSVSIQSSHSGSGSANLGYVLGFNEAWRLTVSHPSIDGETETVVLIKQS